MSRIEPQRVNTAGKGRKEMAAHRHDLESLIFVTRKVHCFVNDVMFLMRSICSSRSSTLRRKTTVNASGSR